VPSRFRWRSHHRNDRLITSSKLIANSHVQASPRRENDPCHQNVESMNQSHATVVALMMPLNSSHAERCSMR
jgi:hypothetical protein